MLLLTYMPSPLDIPAIKGINPIPVKKTEPIRLMTQPFSALAFKIMTDPFVGKLSFFRVYSGCSESGSYVYNSTKGKKERIGRILQMHANNREEIEEVYSGDIAAAVGLKDTTTGDTSVTRIKRVILESMDFPEPVIIDRDRAQNQGRAGKNVASACKSSPGRSYLPDINGRGYWSDNYFRHGRTSSRNHC